MRDSADDDVTMSLPEDDVADIAIAAALTECGATALDDELDLERQPDARAFVNDVIATARKHVVLLQQLCAQPADAAGLDEETNVSICSFTHRCLFFPAVGPNYSLPFANYADMKPCQLYVRHVQSVAHAQSGHIVVSVPRRAFSKPSKRLLSAEVSSIVLTCC